MSRFLDQCLIFYRTVLCLILFAFFSHNSLAGQLFLVDGSNNQYFLESLVGNYSGNEQYQLRVVYAASGHEALGMLFYNATFSSFKITVFEDQQVYGTTIEGHWNGDGSPGFYIYNNDGNTGQTNLVLRETAD